MNAPSIAAPKIAGSLDDGYLTEALRRAGRAPIASAPKLTQLAGGRTGASVTAIRTGDGERDYVLKAVAKGRGFADGLGNEGEAAFWLGGCIRELPAPVFNPTIDVAFHEERDEWWILMDDVSQGIAPRGQWTEQHARRLFDALAQLHASRWALEDSHDVALGTVAGTTRVFVEPALYIATGESTGDSWVPRVAEEFPVARMFLPTFLDILKGEDANFYLYVARRWRSIADALNRHPSTLLHGDTRRANVAFVGDRVGLFDWEFAARGPAATDLAWHWFLQFWAYAPDDGKRADDRLWLRDAYLERLDELLSTPVDRDGFEAAWDLGWLRVFAQLGYVLVDPIASADHTHDDVARVTQLCRDAIVRARRICDARLQ